METKRESLPIDMLQHISRYLNAKEANYWSMTQKGYYTLFRTNPNFFLSNFQTCVARGEQDEAEKFLKINLTLMIQEGWIIDYSNRKFYTSAFKYILGALDTSYMFTMFLDCLREDKQFPLQKKKEITLELIKQYQEFEKEGITYTLDGVTYKNEQHFGFTLLLETLKTYVDNYDPWSADQCRNYFCTEVGKAQTLVPAHVAQHYCEPDVPFDPKPTFTAKTFKRCLDVYNYLNGKTQRWWECIDNLVLGRDFGIIRPAGRGGAQGRRKRVVGAGVGALVPGDLVAITGLFEIRMKDRLAIGTALEALIQEVDQALETQEQTSFQLK